MKWLIFFILTVIGTALYVRYGKNSGETSKVAPNSVQKSAAPEQIGGEEGQSGAGTSPVLSKPLESSQPRPQMPNNFNSNSQPPNGHDNNVPPANNYENYQPPPQDQGYFDPPPPPPPMNPPDDLLVPQVNPPDMEGPPPVFPETQMVNPVPDNPTPFEPSPDTNNGDNNQFYSPPPPPPVDQESF